jgi:DNA adenine methylase
MDPLFKYTGGKRREIKNFSSFFPSFINGDYTYVEPFVGGGAVYFHLNNPGKNIINDFDDQVINFYNQFAINDKKFISELDRIGKITDHDLLSEEYYKQRNLDKNDGLKKISGVQQAIRFFTVNQLAFSGMRRFNSSGEFNVPFGHYKKINTSVIHSQPHRDLLKRTEMFNGDFETVLKDNDNPNTFVFLDPPYTRVFNEYSSDNSFGVEDQKRLCSTIKSLKNANVMMIIDKSELTLSLYSDMIASTYTLKYGVNIKNRFNTDVEHLIVTNY